MEKGTFYKPKKKEFKSYTSLANLLFRYFIPPS